MTALEGCKIVRISLEGDAEGHDVRQFLLTVNIYRIQDCLLTHKWPVHFSDFICPLIFISQNYCRV